MNPMIAAMIAAGVRWALTIASQHVTISDEQTNTILAGVLALVPLVWSLLHKKKVDDKIKGIE